MIDWNSLDFTGTPDVTDKRAANAVIAQENLWRSRQQPAVDPLPNTTDAELKAGAIAAILHLVESVWVNKRQESLNAITPYVETELALLKEAVIAAQERGVSAATLVAAVGTTT